MNLAEEKLAGHDKNKDIETGSTALIESFPM